MLQLRFRSVVLILSAFWILSLSSAGAQQPANAQPNTFSTVAGGYSGTYTAGGVCGGASSGSKYTAADTFGNGCPLTQAILGPSLSGLGVDGAGNVFVEDYSNGEVRRIDAKSGIVTKVIGTNNTVCSTTTSATGTKQDGLGSGCVNTSALGPASARGMNVDPWGNVILGSYNSNTINLVCLATSPLCPGTANRKQVGSFYRIAGCIAAQGGSATAASGTTAYTGGDNSLASPFQNLSGDVAAWGLSGAAATAATVGTAGTCGTNSGGVNSARNAQADKFGNVYIADTNGERYRVVLGPASYNGVTNPLFAIINMNPKYTANEGYIYTILGSFSAFTSGSVTYNIPTAAGGACSSASSSIVSTDTYGDGCAFFETGKPAGATSPAGIGVDKDGNPIFSDNQDSVVRVLYVGGTTMANVISLNNGGITPVVGTVYAIEGTGTVSKSGTPALDVSAASISTGNTKVAVDGQDNVYLSDGSGINIVDSATGYLRRPISATGTLCTGGASNGDGCAANLGQTWTSLSSVGTAIAVDNLGNLYLADSTGRVRKVLAGSLYPTAVGSTFTQTLIFHEPAGTTGITATLLNASPGITIPASAPSCKLYTTSSDNTADCSVVVTITPTVAGNIGATLSLTNTGGGGATTLYPLVGEATNAALVTDVASPTTSTFASLGASAVPASLAVDTGGNFYTIDNHAMTAERISSGGTVTTVGATPANANQIAVDTTGNVYVTAIGSASVTKFTLTGAGTYTSSTITNAAVAKPQGIAFDVQGNMYLSDATTASVYQVPNDAGYATLAAPTTIATGLTNPTLLAFDGSGNLVIADSGVVDRVNASTGALTTIASSSSSGVVISGLTPVGIAADAGDNLYIQDGGSKNVFEIPYQTFAPGYVTALTGETTPGGVAADGKGNLYVADAGLTTPAVVQVARAVETYTFPTGTTTFSGTFSNAGNANSAGYAGTDIAEFPYTGTGSGGCGTVNGTSVLLTGGACIFSVTPNLGNNGHLVSNTTTLLPATSSGSLVLSAQEPSGVTYTTTTVVTGPGSAVYAPSTTTEITFNVAESSSNSNSQNGENMSVTIDSGSPTAYTISGGSVSVPVSGLTVGNHTITAVYPGDGTYLTSNGSANFSITQASTSVTWTPGATTQQYSAAIGTSVLNATASAPGSFIYTATPSGGSAQFVHSASYLPIGTYSLGVTFVPTDSVDYAQSTASVASYSVTKASTTATVAATQSVVAADGTGNYTSVQAAVNALPTGGSIYIKPGTYTGNVTVVQPNIALRGLGGDPTKVILTHAGGSFGGSGNTGVYMYAGEFTSAISNGSQLPSGSSLFTGDEGSATLVVAKGINTALSSATTIPNGFYGENFTLANTYDTDPVTTTTTYLPGSNSGTCTANEGPAMTYAALYNAGTLCASQALTIWTTSDLSVMNNVYATSLQDTIYTASQGAGNNGYVPARQYWFRGKISGDVDFIFGDSAAVFDNTSIYTQWHGPAATGTETIEAQNKAVLTGASQDYLSGYVMNSDVFTSQSTGMTNLYFGRPYGTYSTWIMLNSYVDQVNPQGYTTGLGPTLVPATYGEFNDQLYTDLATNSPDLNGIPYLGAGGNTGTGVNGTREALSTNPGTPMSTNSIPTSLTQAQAQAYFPTNFLGQYVSPLVSTTQNWNPTAALAAAVNAFVPSGSAATVAGGSSVTIVMRPQTPGLGAISNGTYTIPSGTYTLSDTYNGSTTTLASGTLDASGEAYLTTSTLAAGTHNITMTYSGDSNFSGSTTSTPYQLTIAGSGTKTTVVSIQPASNAVYGSPASVTVSISASSGTTVPTGQLLLSVDGGSPLSGTLSGTGTYTFALSGLSAGGHSLSLIYNGDNTFAPSTTNSAMLVARSILQVAANNFTIVAGQTVPTYTATITGFVNGDTQGTSVTGSPSLTTNPATPSTVGVYPIAASTGTLSSANYTFSFTNGSLAIQSATRAASVATGDSRTVTEPVFPAACASLTASLTSVNDDIPTSVDATVTNPDGARIQTALNTCAGTNQAVRLSVDGAGHNAYLTGPLNMPSGVTLLVDPGVYVYFSRNAQDYDAVPGTHTCGTVNSSTATSSCLPLININNVSNVGIMGYGKLDGRGGDTLINAIAPYQGQSWWGLSAIANSGGSQQNPRFIQLNKATNITLYKITLRNSPLFHVSGAANGLTAWDVKIVTPTSSRNTDGIDPDQAQNFTITRSWISDGDDNVAVGASGSASNNAINMSITNNHFFAGHGESIGSYTSAGVSNILWDSNMSSGNGTAGSGSSVNNTADSNSTGIRIKTGNDRGGVVQNIQYSNSCYQYHPTEIQFTPLYDTTPGTLTPNFNTILLQNLSFLTAGTVGLTGANNNGVINPLGVTLDNVSFATLPSSDITPAPTNTNLTYGPGQVSSNFVTDFQPYATVNGNTLTDNRTATSLAPPTCSFTYIAPELTGPAGVPQTILAGQTATAVVILTPAVAGNAYPTGTVTLSDGAGSTSTVTLPGTTDTLSIPLSNLSVGTHTFTATYSGDSNYVPTPSGSPYSTTAPYLITVNAGSLVSTTTGLSGVPATTTFGTVFTATATVAGSSPTGSVEFVVNGAVYATATLTSGTAQASFNLPVGTFAITAIYSGDAVNAGSTSALAPLTVGPALTTTTLSAGTTTTTLGHPVSLTATVASLAGSPTGTVNFTYSATSGGTQVLAGSSILSGGTASASVNLPEGPNFVTATYVASGSFAGSVSTPAIAITVNLPTIIGLPGSPIALPYTMTTLAGGSGLAIPSSGNMACAGATDKYGDGCQATAISFTASDDMRAVVADPFGNVYLSDISATLVRRIAPNGVISNFAGRVTGTACVPSATVGCTPTLVSISKPRGVGSDAAGNIYIADYSLNKVFKVSVTNGLMYLVAGTGTAGTLGDGGAATSAQVDAPRGAWGDTVGNIYIADTSGNKIRVVDANGIIHTFAGTGTAGSTGDGGPATSALISNPQGVVTDVNLNVYIADSSGGKIRVVCVTCGTNSPLDALLAKLGISAATNGDIYTIAGGASTNPAAYPVLATKVLMSPQKLALDNAGNLYISDGAGIIWFLDFYTGYIRPIAGNTATACATATDSIGDGCPATQAVIGDGGNGIGVGADTLGNIYIADTLNGRIRKVSTGLQSPATATAATTTQSVEIHFTAGDTPAATNALAYVSTEWQLGASTCTTNTDTTTDCLLSSGFTPAIPGARSTPLLVNSASGNTANLALTGTGLGSGATLDPAAQTSFGSNLQVAGLATDNAGNTYVADAASKNLLRFAPAAVGQGTSAVGTVLATLTAPGAVAVDPRGFVYVADTSTGLITQVSPGGVITTLPSKFTNPAGLAVDALNNLYVSDSSAQAVDQVNPITGAQRTLALGSLVSPAGLAIDPSGNLLVTDPGTPAIYRFSLQSGVRTTVSSPAVQPSAIATDAAGNLLIADTAAILAVPASANSAPFTVASLTPSALAIDGAGNLYTNKGGSVLKLTRTQGYVLFASITSAPQAISLLESGNQALSLTSVGQSDTTDYSLAAAASTDCTLNGTLPASDAMGGVCSLTATFTPSTTYASPTDTATFNGNLANAALSSPAAVQLVLTGPAVAPTPTISLGAFSPLSPTYGQTVTVSATVSGTSIIPTGTVVFTVDSSTKSASLVNGVATVSLTGLSGGSHTVSAAYTSTNGYASVSTGGSTLTVTPLSQSISFTAPTSPVAFTTSPIALNATGGASGNTIAFSVLSGPGTISSNKLTLTGVGTVQIAANQAGNSNYTAAAQVTQSIVVNQASQAITFAAPASPVSYGVAPIALSATGGASGNAVVFSVVSGPGTISGSALTVTGAGTIQIAANQAGNANYTAAGQVSQSVVVNKSAPLIALQSSANPALVQSSITLTATVSFGGGIPTGTVSFLDGTTVLGSGTITAGVATLTTSSLAAGSHSITAVYSGDANFVTITSTVLTQAVDDFSLSIPSGDVTSLTLLPGHSGVYTLSMSPVGTTAFPASVTLSLSGLPVGATYTFSPATLAAGSGTTTVTLTVNIPEIIGAVGPIRIRGNDLRGNRDGSVQAASASHALGTDQRSGSGMAPFTLAFLLLPFANRIRRAGRKLGRALSILLLVAAAVAATAGLSGCGGTGSGFFVQPPQTYTLTVTGTAGTLVRSTSLTLTIE